MAKTVRELRDWLNDIVVRGPTDSDLWVVECRPSGIHAFNPQRPEEGATFSTHTDEEDDE